MNAKEVFEKEWAIYGLRGIPRDGIWSCKGKTGGQPWEKT